jgi:hypothetical protein
MPSRRQLLATTGALALAAMAGCSESPAESTATTTSASPTASTTPPPNATKTTPRTRTAESTETATATESPESTPSTETPETTRTTEAGTEMSTPDPTETDDPSPTPSGAFSLSAPSFADGGPIPQTFTCDGQDVSPTLDITDPPAATESFALVVADPDAPREDPFVHWLLWNVPGDTRRIPANVPRTETVQSLGGARQGTNDADGVGYTGPCPPADDSPHRYRSVLYALDGMLSVEAGATHEALSGRLAERRLDATTLTGTYARQRSQYRFG